MMLGRSLPDDVGGAYQMMFWGGLPDDGGGNR